jgi:AhpD family alkylhydroperoxidase
MTDAAANYYYDPHDKVYSRSYRAAAPDVMAGFSQAHVALFDNANTSIGAKEKELIALAVAASTQCAYCLEAHSKAAKKAGATEQEVVEALLVSTMVHSGASMAHGRMALKFFHDDGA